MLGAVLSADGGGWISGLDDLERGGWVMSWAAHNPEKYEEICREGVEIKLGEIYKSVWHETPDAELIKNLVDAICQEAPKVWDVLMDISFKEIGEAEADYWGSMVDMAKERMERNP